MWLKFPSIFIARDDVVEDKDTILANAAEDPNSDNADALTFEVSIVARVPDPIDQPDEDQERTPVDQVEADAVG